VAQRFTAAITGTPAKQVKNPSVSADCRVVAREVICFLFALWHTAVQALPSFVRLDGRMRPPLRVFWKMTTWFVVMHSSLAAENN